MSDSETLAFVAKVMSVLDANDAHGDLFFRTGRQYGGGEFRTPASFFINCNDTFWWGTADLEEITPANVGELERAYADARAAEEHGQIWGGELFCARVRGMRPQHAAFPKHKPGLWPLFDAAGPPREPGLGNSHRHPSEEPPPCTPPSPPSS